MLTAASKSDRHGSTDSRRELLLAVDGFAKRGGITRDRAITAWYASALLGVDEDDAIDAASVDGPEDGGCDFVYVDEDQDVLYVLQGYVSDRSDRAASVRKWNALVAAVANVRDPMFFKHGGRSDIYETIKEVDLNSYSMVFGLVTLAGKSDQIARQLESTVRSKTYGPEFSFFYEHQDSLYDKYLIARSAERNVQADSIEFTGRVAEIKGDFGLAIVGSVSAAELARLHGEYGNHLFEGNVRLFIGQRKGGINEKIVETSQNRPGDFWALNNGITIVAESFEGITESRFKLRHFSIVNGCQTTVSLSRAIEACGDAARSQVLVRVVAAKKTLLTDIVRYNNTQNPVKLSAVRLLDPIQESLRSAFSSIEYNYAPKQEGAKQVKHSKRIELDRITQYLAATSDATVLEAVTRKAELYDRLYKTIYPRGLRPEKVFLAWLIAQSVEAERTLLLDANEGSTDLVMKTILGIHGIPWGIYVANYLVEQSGSDLSKLALKRMDTEEFRNSIAKYAKRAMELYAEIAVNILTSGDEESNPRNAVRVKVFLDKLKRNLVLKKSKISAWKLPKLHASGVA